MFYTRKIVPGFKSSPARIVRHHGGEKVHAIDILSRYHETVRSPPVVPTPASAGFPPMLLAKRAGLSLALTLATSCLCAADEPYVIPAARRDHWAWKPP